jgi:hypothetical protein
VPDYRVYGYEFGTVADRLVAFERALGVIRVRLPRLNPPPVRGDIPILIGGAGERRMLRLVAEHADIWNLIADPETFRHKSAILDVWCERVDRDPGEIERSVLMTGEEQLGRVDEYVELGATHVIFDLGPPPWPFHLAEWLVEWRDRRRTNPGTEMQRASLGSLATSVADVRSVEIGDTEMAVGFDP